MGMKKITALLLAVVMVVGLLPLSVFAAEDLTIAVGGSQELSLSTGESVTVSFTSEKDGASYAAYAAAPFSVETPVDATGSGAGFCSFDAGTNNYYCRVDNATQGETYSFQVTNLGPTGTATLYLVEVSQPAQENVTLVLENPNQVFLGATASMCLSAEPFYNMPAGFTVTSSDPQVVAVSYEHSFGAEVQFVGKGTATLTASWTGADGVEQSVSCPITVEKEALLLSLDSEQTYTLQPQESAAYTVTNDGAEAQQYAFYVTGADFGYDWFNWQNYQGDLEYVQQGDYTVLYSTVPAGSSACVLITNKDPNGQTISGTVGVKQRITPQQGDAQLVAKKTELKPGEYMDIALQFSSVAMWDGADMTSWTSSNENILINNSDSDSCEVHANKTGTATVTVTTKSGLTASCELTVLKDTMELTTGMAQFVAQPDGGIDLLYTPETDGLYRIYVDNSTYYFDTCKDADGNMPKQMMLNNPNQNGVLYRLTGGKQYTIPLNGPAGGLMNVTVEPVTKAESFSMDVLASTGYAGGEGRLTFKFPEGTADILTITSDNEAVAEVNQQYADVVWIYFMSVGTANITVTNGTQTEVVPVTVMEPDYTLAKEDKLTLTLQPRQEVAIDAVVTEAKDYSIVVNDPKISAASGYARSGADASYSVTKVYMSPNYNSNIFTVGNYAYNEAVTVEVYFTDAVVPESFGVSKTELALQTGEEVYLDGVFSPIAGIEWVDWTVDNISAVMVNRAYGSARVTAVGVGTATVTGTTLNGLTATCTVTVTEPEATLKLDETQTVQIPGSLMNIHFTPAETGLYWLSQPYETMVYGNVQVMDANGIVLTNFWHEDADMTNGGQVAKLEAGKTYTFRFTSNDGAGTAPQFTMRKLTDPASITVTKMEVTGHVGETAYVEYEILPDGAPDYVTVTVADESIVNVYTYERGVLELWLQKPGTTKVLLMPAAGIGVELTVTCKEPVATLTAAGQTASADLEEGEAASFRFTFPEDGEFYFYTDSENVKVTSQMGCSYNYSYNNVYQGYICGGTAGDEFYLIVTNRGEAQKVNVGVDKPVAPESLKLVLTEDKLSACNGYVGEIVDVYAYLSPALAFSPDLTFGTSDPAVAVVEGGMSINERTLRIFGTGTATITAEVGSMKAEAAITVIEPEKSYEFGQVGEYTLQPGERIAYSVSIGEGDYEGLFVSTEAVGVKFSGGGFVEFLDTGDQAVYEKHIDIGLRTYAYLLILENLQDEPISGKFYLGKEVPATGLVIPEKITGYAGDVLVIEAAVEPFYGLVDTSKFNITTERDSCVEEVWQSGRDMYLQLGDVGETEVGFTYAGKSYTCKVTALCPCFNHISQVNAKAATCTEDGILAHWVCNTCGKTYEDKEATKELTSVVVPATSHKEETVAGKAATCTETGLTEGKKCSVCGEVTVAQKTIEKLAHKEETVAAKAATCTEEGLTEGKKCSVCGTVTVAQKTVEASGHKLVKTEAKAATYTAEGNIAYWTCSVCEKLFADEKGETEIKDPATVIVAKLVQVDEKEESKVNVSEDAMDQAIEEALKGSIGSEDTGSEDTDSGDSGSADSGSTGETTPAPKKEVVIKLDQVETKVESAVLPVTSVNKVAEADANLTIQLTEVKVTMDTQTLKTVSEAIKAADTEIPADSKVSLKVETVEKEAVEEILTQSQKTALVNTNVVAAVSASLIVESAQETKSIHDFGGGKITIRLPFAPEEGKVGDDYTILYVAEDGETELIDTHYENGHLVFDVSHFSEYVVVEAATVTPPADPDSPATGDNAVILPVLVLMAVAALGITALLLEKKRFAR